MGALSGSLIFCYLGTNRAGYRPAMATKPNRLTQTRGGGAASGCHPSIMSRQIGLIPRFPTDIGEDSCVHCHKKYRTGVLANVAFTVPTPAA